MSWKQRRAEECWQQEAAALRQAAEELASRLRPQDAIGRRSEESGEINSECDDERWRQEIAALREAAQLLVRSRHDEALEDSLQSKSHVKGQGSPFPAKEVEYSKEAATLADEVSAAVEWNEGELGLTADSSDRPQSSGDQAFTAASTALHHPAQQVRSAAVRVLYDLDPERAASLLNSELRDAIPEWRSRIGTALVASGLVKDAIETLTRESHTHAYRAFSLLLLAAKAGEVQPLIQVIEDHPSLELKLAMIKVLGLSGNLEIVPAFDGLVAQGAMPPLIHSAVLAAIHQIHKQVRDRSFSARALRLSGS